ncbi:MAG: hypothetical protein ACR2PX_29250 [Endozoicomonas sp.]|uniref:hypothetical protein n=1 Tax=Endozoicomonas sp. TaxID=1892382 RepID=UPI003D9BB035
MQPPTLLDSHEYVMLCHMLCGRLTEDKLDDIPTEALERITRQALLDLDYMRHQVLKALKHLKKIDPEYRAIAAEKLEGQLKAYEWLEEPFKECLELFEQGKYRKINYSIAKKMGEEAEPFELSVTAYDKRIALIEHWHMLLRFMEEWRITMPSIAELVDKKFTNLKVSMPNLRTYGRKGALSNQAKLEQLTLDITQMQDNWQVISSLASMKAMPNFWPTNPYDQHSVCLPHETKPLPSCHDLKSFLPRGEDAVAARKESAWLPVAPERKEESTRTFCFATKKGAEIRSKGLQMREQSLWKHKLGADLQNPVVYMEIINPRPDQYFSFQPVATHAYSTNCTGALKELNTLSRQVNSLKFSTMDGTQMTAVHIKELSKHLQTLEKNMKRWERHIPSLQEIMDQVYYFHPLLDGGKVLVRIVKDPQKSLSTASKKFTDFIRDKKSQSGASPLPSPVLRRRESERQLTQRTSPVIPRLTGRSSSCPELPPIPHFVPTLWVLTPSPVSSKAPSSVGSDSPHRDLSPEPAPVSTEKTSEDTDSQERLTL